ncbi:serine/threonine-protein kinase [Carex littledalei]|uniref:Serine/threonine-protein kinase n=1 Tax=Carex littledalei TaxID=544730 RepID=A0A833Q945_9POAL|nr:serine/threonine-protein kinase [Carex littledalei]
MESKRSTFYDENCSNDGGELTKFANAPKPCNAFFILCCYFWPSSSSCGELGNITYPYYLPGTCKWKAYELQCDGNDTVLYIGATKYLVKDMSIENKTLRLVDPDLAVGGCRLPKQTTFTEYPSIFDSYNNYIIYFFNCTEEVEDSMYKLIDCMDGRSRVYAAYDSGITGDIPNSCSLAGHTVADYEVYKRWNDSDGVDMMKMLRWGVILRWDIIDDDMCSLSSYCWISTKRDLKFMMRDRELTTGDKLLGVLYVQSSFLSCIHYPPHYEFGTNSHLVLGFMIILVALLDILLLLSGKQPFYMKPLFPT